MWLLLPSSPSLFLALPRAFDPERSGWLSLLLLDPCWPGAQVYLDQLELSDFVLLLDIPPSDEKARLFIRKAINTATLDVCLTYCASYILMHRDAESLQTRWNAVGLTVGRAKRFFAKHTST